jgi:periplasmic copper chaperone A
MTFVRFALTLVAVLGMAVPALAQSPQSAPIKVEGAWARPTPGAARTGAAYMTLTNGGAADDRLISVATPVAGMADVHVTTEENGVMKMRPAGAIDVKPGVPTRLQPGGLHVMLMDLKAPLADGQTFPLTLTFEKAGKVDVSVHVQRTAPGGAGMPGMGAGGMGAAGSMAPMQHMSR